MCSRYFINVKIKEEIIIGDWVFVKSLRFLVSKDEYENMID